MTPPRIQILPSELASQIAAGEVVERPASVVKELTENAIDAGARRIQVEIEQGGMSRIRVVDDGCGMNAEETQLALERHATSKLRDLKGLTRITTLGFRGEALPSIASVSRLSVTSRPTDGVSGTRYETQPAAIPTRFETGCPVGTTVEVADLFFNVPARKKFLKTERTEAAHVAETVLHLALARPEVHFVLIENGRTSLDLPQHPGLLERAEAALSRRGRGPLHFHASGLDEVRVECVLGSPAHTAGTARNVYQLVNLRGVRDRLLLRMLGLGYGGLLERGRYPLAVVHLKLPVQAVDVNVHPQKHEVRFRDESEVARAVRHAVAEGVRTAPWATASPPSGGPAASPPARTYRLHGRPASQDASPRGFRPPVVQLAEPLVARSPTAPAGTVDDSAPEGSLRRCRYLGQLLSTYLVLEDEGALVLVDQHAAHERVTYSRLQEAMTRGEVRMQRLLFPAQITLQAKEEAAVREQAGLLRRCGFEVELLSGRTCAIRGVPALLGDADPEALLRDVAAELTEDRASETVERTLDHLAATLACHSSVRAGQALGEAEVLALLRSVDEAEQSGHCPHGRPVVVRLSESEIRRRFGRG